jgi:hypothetical protein
MNINIFQSVRQAYTHKDDMAEGTFSDIVALLEDSQVELVNKEDGQLFNLCSWVEDFENPPEERFNPQATEHPRTELIRRSKVNVDHIFCLLLDVDGTMTLDETIAKWAEYEFFIYSTHSNSAKTEKFRLVVPLETPLSLYEFDSRHEAMCSLFNVDGASFTISQCFYFPSYSKANADIAFMFHNKVEKRYNALNIKTIKLNTNIAPEFTPPTAKTPMGDIVYKTLLTGNDLHYADVLSLAVLCKAHGISVTDFVNVVNTIADKDSDLRTAKVNLRELYNKGFNSYITNDKMIKLMKKLNCNTWRFV